MTESWAEGFAAQLQQDAEVLRRWGQNDLAEAIEGLVVTIRERLSEWQLKIITLGDAATDSGYSEAHIRRLIAEGRIENVGEGRRVKVRRCDLPKKAGRRSQQACMQEPDLAAQVLRARGLETP